MAYNVSNLSDWKTKFMTESVQNNNNTFGSDFLSSESTVMFSGPAEYTENMISSLVPIGLVQNVQVSQQKQIQQLFEVGSRKPFFVPGRTVVSGGIARILFDGPSLMYAMYLKGVTSTGALINPSGKTSGPWTPIDKLASRDYPADLAPGGAVGDGASLGGYSNDDGTVTFKTDVAQSVATPSYFFINLSSSFFNRPTGLGFVLYDMENQPYGGFYLENCYIQAHTFSVASQQTVLVENVSFRASSVSAMDWSLITN